jgi:putative ABC transport system permease protein
MALDYLGSPASGTGSELVPPDGKIIVDKTFARQAGIGVGDDVPLGGQTLTVSDVRDVGNVLVTQFSFVSAADFERLVGVPDTVNYFLVTFKPGVDRSTVEANLAKVADNTQVMETDAWAKTASDKGTGDFLPIIRVILSISFIVGLAVLSLVIYSATIERSREYAIMKVIGASPLGLYRIVLSQSTFIAITGFGAGVGLAFVFNAIAGDVVPQFITYIRPIDIFLVLLATAGMTFVASVLPLARIAGVEPASVFRA